MTISREYRDGPIYFECDHPRCPEVCETKCTEFDGALAKAKSRGWTVRKTPGAWEHRCPDHAGAVR